MIDKKIKMTIGESNATLEAQKQEADRQAQLARDAAARVKNVVQKRTRGENIASGVAGTGRVEVLDSGKSEYNNCVDYVKTQRYMPRTKNGNAGTTPINTHEPTVGAIAVQVGHVGLVESVEGDVVIIRDANYKHGKLTRRWVTRSEIKGYYQ